MRTVLPCFGLMTLFALAAGMAVGEAPFQPNGAEQKTATTSMVGLPFEMAIGGKGKAGAGIGKATPPVRIKLAKDFKIELVWTVPRGSQGSWVNMCTLPDGRLIVSDQGGAGLFLVTPPAVGGSAS